MKILVIEPGSKPQQAEIDGSLESMQKLVGGLIQVIYPFEDQVALVCNDEGKLVNLPFNRALRNDKGDVYDLICGSFFICGAPADSDGFESLTEEQMTYFTKYYKEPEVLINLGGSVMVVKEEMK